jgi:MFS family permease
VASQAAIGYWFDERRGLAMGLSGSGTGFGCLFFVLIVNASLSSNGLKYALQILALFELIGLLLASCLASRFHEPDLKNIPSNTPVSPASTSSDLSSDGETSTKTSTKTTTSPTPTTPPPTVTGSSSRNVSINKSPDESSVEVNKNKKEEIDKNAVYTSKKQQNKSLWRSKKFIYLLVAFGIKCFGDSVPLTFLPFYAQSLGVSVVLSNHLVAILGIGSGLGRIFTGFLADKFSKMWLLLGSMSISGILTLGWLGYDNYTALVCYAFFYGYFFGSYNILVGPISLELFGPEEVNRCCNLN